MNRSQIHFFVHGLAALVLVALVSMSGMTQTQTGQAKGKNKADLKKETSPPVSGASLGPGSFEGLAKDAPVGNRLVLMDPPLTTTQLPPAPNTKGLNAQQKKAIQAARQKAQAQLKELMAKPRREVEFQVPDSVPVRFLVFPEPFDDKGNLIKPTPEEKDKMRGPDKTLPGYTGRLDQIKQGQPIRIEQTGGAKSASVKMVIVLGEANSPLPAAKETSKPKGKKGNP